MKRKINYSERARKQRRKLMLFLVIGAVLTIWLSIGATAEMENEGFVVTVQPGDTMWEICEDNLPANTEIRDYVYKVKYINKLKTMELEVGQEIFLPYVG